MIPKIITSFAYGALLSFSIMAGIFIAEEFFALTTVLGLIAAVFLTNYCLDNWNK